MDGSIWFVLLWYNLQLMPAIVWAVGLTRSRHDVISSWTRCMRNPYHPASLSPRNGRLNFHQHHNHYFVPTHHERKRLSVFKNVSFFFILNAMCEKKPCRKWCECCCDLAVSCTVSRCANVRWNMHCTAVMCCSKSRLLLCAIFLPFVVYWCSIDPPRVTHCSPTVPVAYTLALAHSGSATFSEWMDGQRVDALKYCFALS